jgi:hypothetical protein
MLAPMDSEEIQEGEQSFERYRRPALPDREGRGPIHDDQPPLQRMASAVGNKNFTRALARMRDGDGILPGGIVHPDVESAIAMARGSGRGLDRSAAASIGSSLGDSFSDVRVHTDTHANDLARSVSARAFTVGSDIFFAQGEYQPSSSGGTELLAHELTHVVQQRGAPQTGPLTVSQPGDALEREAEATAASI